MAAALVSRVLPMFSQLNAALLKCTLASRCHDQTTTFELAQRGYVETYCCMPGGRITHPDRPTRRVNRHA
jgi:hypothetical protein